MAFQTGTQVRPELARADVSGFARGGAAIGAGILQGIQNYQQQKQITASALADLEGRIGGDPTILTAMEKAGEGNPKLAKALKNLNEGNYNQADVLTLGGFASAFEKQKIAAQQSQLREAQIAEMERKPGKIIVRPDGIIEQNGKFMGQMSKQAAERIPTKVLEQRNFQENYKKARELLSQGKVAEAQDIITSLGMIDKITGYPIPVSELFQDIETDPDPTPEPEPTPRPAPTPKSGFRIVP